MDQISRPISWCDGQRILDSWSAFWIARLTDGPRCGRGAFRDLQSFELLVQCRLPLVLEVLGKPLASLLSARTLSLASCPSCETYSVSARFPLVRLSCNKSLRASVRQMCRGVFSLRVINSGENDTCFSLLLEHR